jgi:hypothetical protein
MEETRGMYMISVHPSRVNYYYEPLNRPCYHSHKTISHEETDDLPERSADSLHSVASKKPAQFQDNYHHGKISKTAERKINRAIDYMLYLAKPKRLPNTKSGKGLSFRLNFVTLTLSSEQIHTDHEIQYRIFHPFLVSLCRQFKIQHYLWRAERQSGGGLHYHLITDRFIPWQRLRELWNNAQQHLGYVTRYRENQLAWHSGGFRVRPELYKKWSQERQYKAWKEGCRTDWNQPNSTDVHSLILVHNVKAYFKKYMTKEGQNSDIKGRLWGCAQALSVITGGRAAVYSKIDDDLGKLEADKVVKTFKTDYYTTIFVTPEYLLKIGCTEILSVFNQYLSEKFPNYRPPTLFP